MLNYSKNNKSKLPSIKMKTYKRNKRKIKHFRKTKDTPRMMIIKFIHLLIYYLNLGQKIVNL